MSDIADIDTKHVPYIVWEGEPHPSAYAWEVVSSAFIKKLGLK